MMRRAAVEPVISDLKVEQRLDRDYLRAGPAIAQTPCSLPPSTTYYYLCDGSSNFSRILPNAVASHRQRSNRRKLPSAILDSRRLKTSRPGMERDVARRVVV
jgi:hypothetical protein